MLGPVMNLDTGRDYVRITSEYSDDTVPHGTAKL